MHVPFSLIDVFADKPLTGNPLAVVLDSEHLDELTIQRIANEFNQAETTFILPARHKSADRRLRSVTASGHEVFGAGHNSLGAWWWLAESRQLKLADGPNHFLQEIGESILPVEIHCRAGQVVSVVLTQSAPIYGAACEDVAGLATALGLNSGDIGHDSLPIQVVSTGAPHLMVPARDRTVIERANPDGLRLAKILESVDGEGCYLFSLDTALPSSTAHARFFNPTVGIIEDSATGTAAGPLACLLVRHGVVKDGSPITIEQGYEMKRPSLLRLEVNGESVRLAGSCVRSADGTLRVS